MKPRTGKLEDEYAYATECQLATLSQLCMVTRSALSEITRQRGIAEHMLKVCQEHASEITWERGPWRDFGRVREILDEAREHGLPHALTRWTLTQFIGTNSARWLASFEKSEAQRQSS